MNKPLPESREAEPVFMRETGQGLALVSADMELLPDFAHLLPRLAPGKLQRELLIRAVKTQLSGVHAPTAVDATAGLGEDALLLAAAGFSVRMYECDSMIAALLRDAMRRAHDVPELAPIMARMELHEEDSVAAMPKLPFAPDVILLDPMFPARTKSAAVKKKFQLLHQLEAPCKDEAALLDAAIAARPRKVVIKRPPKGPYLAGRKPSYSLTGKAVRYDCYSFAWE